MNASENSFAAAWVRAAARGELVQVVGLIACETYLVHLALNVGIPRSLPLIGRMA